MNDIEILCYSITSQKEKGNAANNIIQRINKEFDETKFKTLIIQVFEIISDWLIEYGFHYGKNIIFVLNAVLDINPAMFVAIILAISTDKLLLIELNGLIKHNNNGTNSIGLLNSRSIRYYHVLLDHHEFDVNNLDMLEVEKELIQNYRAEKYSGKMTKAAIKNNYNGLLIKK